MSAHLFQSHFPVQAVGSNDQILLYLANSVGHKLPVTLAVLVGPVMGTSPPPHYHVKYLAYISYNSRETQPELLEGVISNPATDVVNPDIKCSGHVIRELLNITSRHTPVTSRSPLADMNSHPTKLVQPILY
mgnify:CR=1 FL=1